MRQAFMIKARNNNSAFARTSRVFPALLTASMFFSLAAGVSAQVSEPKPGAPRSVTVPAVKETKLNTGLTVAVIERKSVPTISVQLLSKNGSNQESRTKAGLANLTASLLTKGTKTRSATQIAEDIEFLGASIYSFAGWQNASAGIGAMTDKFDAAMAIFADAVLNPTFTEDELKLAKSQTLDELTFNLTQPGFLAGYVASRYSYGEHPSGGTPASIESLTRSDVVKFYEDNYRPSESVLIFVGDITQEKAMAAATKYFGGWRKQGRGYGSASAATAVPEGEKGIVKRILVVDLPKSGQASVNYAKPVLGVGRASKDFYAALVLNSLFGGGYSSRLNQEIRIKRGLSYGANSFYQWRTGKSNFRASTQTKNESAAEVAELMVAEIKRLADSVPPDEELGPRKSVLTGGFGRSLETTGGVANALAGLYIYNLPASDMNSHMPSINGVKNTDIRAFAVKFLNSGDLIIVGDYSVFRDDLAKRFRDHSIQVIKVDELDVESETLRRSIVP
ncbi:MAG: M16 family metallopeptidase [Pyrinomonadaceae bacterium]